MKDRLEHMDSFFTSRVDGYDEHMLEEVEGCKKGYRVMAHLVPNTCQHLLDLGCGTGLDLDEIFKVLPDIQVTGIDMTQAMLDRLKQKHPDKKVTLICGDYFNVPFGTEKYDCAVSFQTMHHFSHKAKTGLYRKIARSLESGGIYIECDYMVENQDEEDFYYAENARLRMEQGIADNEFIHYDTPCTMENQIGMFHSAGFHDAKTVFRQENTTIQVAKKI